MTVLDVNIHEVIIHDQAIKNAKRKKIHYAQFMDKWIDDICQFVAAGEKVPYKNIRYNLGGRFYKCYIRDTNRADRAVFSLKGSKNGLIIHWVVIGSHSDGANIDKDKLPDMLTTGNFQIYDDFDQSQGIDAALKKEVEEAQHRNLYHQYPFDNDSAVQRLIDNPNLPLQWRLDDEQQAIYAKQEPVILRGAAGSGKTAISIYRLMRNSDQKGQSLYLTYSQQLKENSKKHFNDFKNINQRADFFTIDEFCRRLIPDHKKAYFQKNPITLLGFEQFLNNIKNHQLRNQATRISTHRLWEEFRGVIKGCYPLAENLQRQPYLTLDEYQDLNKLNLPDNDGNRYSLFEKNERKLVYQIFQTYQSWLQDHQEWDELDLARTALKHLNTLSDDKKSYIQIIVDEIQDLTTYHLQMILQLKCQPETLLLAGDAYQSIYPSRFDWRRLRDQLYKTYNISADFSEMRTNYRCTPAIIELINALFDWRKILDKGEKQDFIELKSAHTGGHSIQFLNTQENITTPTDKLAADIVILVGNEHEKMELTKIGSPFQDCKGQVLTIHESKGLEYKTVILYQFFNTYQHDLLIKNPTLHHLRYLINLFNVACTRAYNLLIIMDNDAIIKKIKNKNLFQQPLNTIKEWHTPNALQLWEIERDRTSTREEYIEQAEHLEENHNWKDAADLWERIAKQSHDVEDNQRHYYCLAKWYEERREWLSSADAFKKAHKWHEAYHHYKTVEKHIDMLVVTLEMPNEGTALQRFFDDIQNMPKLPKNLWASLAEKINDPKADIPVSILFRFAAIQIQAQYADIDDTVQAISQNTNQHSQQYQDILQRLNS